MISHYPVFLDLRNRPCLVVGSGTLAAEKKAGLERAGAQVTETDRFDAGVAAGMFLIVADVDEATARAIRDFGEKHRIFVNVVDKPAYCSFILPSILQRGHLQVGVSTGGASPALAAWVRRKLEGSFGDEYAVLLEELGSTRPSVRQAIPDYQDRKDFYYALFESGILDLARREGAQKVRAYLEQRLEEFRG